MVAIGVFYPIAINATAGVLQISRIYLDVGKSFKASRWETFRTIALPGALPFIMTGVKLGAGLGPHPHRDRRDGRRQERHRLHDLERVGDLLGREDVCRPVRHRHHRLRHDAWASTNWSGGSSRGRRRTDARPAPWRRRGRKSASATCTSISAACARSTTCRSTSPRARSSSSSARRAAARPRCCASSAGSSR